MSILSTLQSRFEEALKHLVDDVAPWIAMVKPSTDPKFGDFQANCAMPLKAVLNRPPREIAQSIVDRLEIDDFCQPPEVAGPGFINITLKTDWVAERVNQTAEDPRFGVNRVETPRKIIIDYSSPNVAKPMHVGHLRSTVIGAALSHVYAFLGHEVTGDNHIGDWGTQFGMIIYGYKHFRDEQSYHENPVDELARLYRFVNALCDYPQAKQKRPKLTERLENLNSELASKEANPPKEKAGKKELKKLRQQVQELLGTEDAPGLIAQTQAKIDAVESSPELQQAATEHPEIVALTRGETAKLHAGDLENRQLWDEFLPHCLKALEEVYDRLGIRFDLTLGESFYDPQLADVVAELQSQGLSQPSDGAQCVFLDGKETPFIVQKADGAYNYATTDLATIRYRVEQLNADEILYVVDHRQSEHFDMLFETARRWRYDQVALKHVKFGTVMGRDGRPFKTRSGDTVGLMGLLDEAVTKAYQIVSENDEAKKTGPELSEKQRMQIAETVGIGGIKYADLKHNRESDYIFDYEKMLAMNGDTATYLQYAYARLSGIFRKANVNRDSLDTKQPIVLATPAERALGLQLLRFEDALLAVAEDARPNLLTQYLFDVGSKLSTFYEHCRVIDCDDPKLKASRFRLIDYAGRVIQQGLSLLGIEVREQM